MDWKRLLLNGIFGTGLLAGLGLTAGLALTAGAQGTDIPVGLSLFFQDSAMQPVTLAGTAPRYLQEIDLVASVPSQGDLGVQPLLDHGELASLDWSGVRMVDEDWRPAGDGTFIRQVSTATRGGWSGPASSSSRSQRLEDHAHRSENLRRHLRREKPARLRLRRQRRHSTASPRLHHRRHQLQAGFLVERRVGNPNGRLSHLQRDGQQCSPNQRRLPDPFRGGQALAQEKNVCPAGQSLRRIHSADGSPLHLASRRRSH